MAALSAAAGEPLRRVKAAHAPVVVLNTNFYRCTADCQFLRYGTASSVTQALTVRRRRNVTLLRTLGSRRLRQLRPREFGTFRGCFRTNGTKGGQFHQVFIHLTGGFIM